MFGLSGIGARIQLYIAVALAFAGIYSYWKHDVEQKALLEYNQKQLEQNIEDQKKLKATLDDIQQRQNEIIKQNEEDKKAYEQKIGAVYDNLDSKEIQKQNRNSSDILKNTIKQLKEFSK